jgi:hypothetical protein
MYHMEQPLLVLDAARREYVWSAAPVWAAVSYMATAA